MATTKEFIGHILYSRNQARIFHWQGGPLAFHQAMETYDNDLMSVLDPLIECWSSIHGITGDITNIGRYLNKGKDTSAPVKFFENLLSYVESNRSCFGKESDIQNQIDELISFIRQTIYRLKIIE
jgi:hypothetical protein